MVVVGDRGKRSARVPQALSSYADAADSYAADHSEELSEEGDDDHSFGSQDNGESNLTASESEANSKGSDDENEDFEEEEAVEEEEVVNHSQTNMRHSTEGCTFDLRNLVAINSHQVSSASLYSKKDKNPRNNEKVTISPDNPGFTVSGHLLFEKAREGCTQLLSALWELPTERSDAGPVVTLPSHFDIKIPRALPPPPPKKETKWEKFAKERGIAVNKEKRSRKVWDEASGTWMYRHGYEKANNDAHNWPILEVKGNDDPYADPWERLRDAKRERVEKNLENRMRNQERAGLLTKGTATKVSKNREKVRQAGKAGGNAERDGTLPSGVPVDLKTRKGSHQINSVQRGKESTVAALLATQRSTASLGRFDKMRESEPERRKALAGMKKRKFESTRDKKATEAEKGMKLLKSVMNGGGVARDKAKRNGSLAKGETAYDYDYGDGLGPGSFKKKKGRAAAGKMKKVTKKRVK